MCAKVAVLCVRDLYGVAVTYSLRVCFISERISRTSRRLATDGRLVLVGIGVGLVRCKLEDSGRLGGDGGV